MRVVNQYAEGEKKTKQKKNWGREISRKEELVVFFFFKDVLYKADHHQTKPQHSGRGPQQQREGETKGLGWVEGGGWWAWEGERLKTMLTEIRINGLRLSVKADALVAEPTRMLGTGRGWCLLPERQSSTPICLPRP